VSTIDDIAADLRDQAEARREARENAWRYGTTDPATLRAIHEAEARRWPESTLLCDGCKRHISVALLVQCAECGASVCADCDPNCPHTPEAQP
jgi:hypothetical protein